MKLKTFLLLISFAALCSATAFGQSGAVLSNQVQVVSVPEHPAHAEQHDMAMERPLVGGSANAYTYAQGEVPLWEFGPFAPPPTPLGDVARAFRKEKSAAKKAEIVFEKVGS